eukprot:405057-Prymnesium_polylepis.1
MTRDARRLTCCSSMRSPPPAPSSGSAIATGCSARGAADAKAGASATAGIGGPVVGAAESPATIGSAVEPTRPAFWARARPLASFCRSGSRETPLSLRNERNLTRPSRHSFSSYCSSVVRSSEIKLTRWTRSSSASSAPRSASGMPSPDGMGSGPGLTYGLPGRGTPSGPTMTMPPHVILFSGTFTAVRGTWKAAVWATCTASSSRSAGAVAVPEPEAAMRKFSKFEDT